MIWNETFERRILHITSKTINPYGLSVQHDSIIRFKAHEPPPIALQICHESRTLALKHYTPSFLSTTFPLTDARGIPVNQPAIYFNPKLDTVYILEIYGDKIHNLSQFANQETIQSINALAVEFPYYISPILANQFIRYLSEHLLAFERLETFVLVFGGDAESARKIMEDALMKAHDRLQGECVEWKVPAVKVMDSRSFERDL
jgi:hypothetical protein